MLRAIVQEVNTAEDLEEALEIIVRRVRDAMGTEVCTVYMRDATTDRFIFQATEGLNKAEVVNASLEPGEGLVGLVAEREELINLEEATSHPSFHLIPGIGEESFSELMTK